MPRKHLLAYLYSHSVNNSLNVIGKRIAYSQIRNQCSSNQPSSSTAVFMEYERGLPHLTVPLPSRQEPCRFSLKPISDTVGSLCDNLKFEDKGLDFAAIYSPEGIRVANSTSIEHLLLYGSFKIRLNDKFYDVSIPSLSKDIHISSDQMRQLDDLKATIATLHASLCIDDFKIKREQLIIKQLEVAEAELNSLIMHKLKIEQECEAHAERVMWCCFSLMGIQTGMFARLTWWEYSWDIMEPVTYFATYATVIATFGYYLYTRQSFEYPTARERIFTKAFYRRAQKQKFNIVRYNELVEEVEDLRRQLKRIRDPIFQHLPVSYLSRFDTNTDVSRDMNEKL
ncbi:unnamed protein product [Auanema sp. JU1783]|nr:unnamed protein product [Auanema sp. JU1783]